MKFFIRRTSEWDGDDLPCSGAKKIKGLITHHGTAKTLEETRKKEWGGHFWFWNKDKIYHRKTHNGVACDSEASLWEIQIDSLEQLMNLVETEGRLIISVEENIYGKGPQIEIYDGYRE